MAGIEHVDLLSDREPDGWRSGEPGAWRTEKNLSIELPDNTFAGLEGAGYCFTGCDLVLGRGFGWDGSTGVADTKACGIPSLFHDVVCWALESSSFGRWHRWQLRRLADKWYSYACDLRGMWGIRSGIRFWGLRVLNPVYRIWRKIRG